MTDAKRRLALYIALTGVVGWSAWLALSETPPDDGADIALVEPAPPARATAGSPSTDPAAPATAANVPLGTPESRLGLSSGNLFPGQTWYVPPPPPPPQAYVPPPPPEAPPLPFSYMGRWQEAGVTTFYLSRGTLPLSVRAGQVIDGVWRLDTAANGVLNFTYLPLNQTRSLRTGE